MRIHLHDGSGHPFQVQLSRELARRGHEVLHTHAAQWVSGHGRLERIPTDPPTLRIEAITAPRAYDKYSPARRIAWELSYARAWKRVLRAEPCDLVISCNTQLIAAGAMLPFFARRRVPWVLWHQDVASLALADEFARKLPGPAARAAAHVATATERAVVRQASSVIAIGDPFIEQYRAWKLDVGDAHVIPNWAPLDDIRPQPRTEMWPATQGIPAAALRLLYAGTLGRKHNPQLLVDLVDGCEAAGIDVQLVVASEGPGADHLARAARTRPRIRVVGFQPADQLGEMLSSGDVLVAILEPEASRFSIPSKVFSYLAAGRPVLAFVPPDNPCAADVRAGGGFVAAPDTSGVSLAIGWIRATNDPQVIAAAGLAARSIAERRFDIVAICDRFEVILRRAVRMGPSLTCASREWPRS